jgi:hypothetical protein
MTEDDHSHHYMLKVVDISGEISIERKAIEGGA